jgi:hypothetical protein
MVYQVVECDSREQLEERVSALLTEGWQAQGGVCVVYSPNTGKWWYYQAVLWPQQG